MVSYHIALNLNFSEGLLFLFSSGEDGEVLIDTDSKSNLEIIEHLNKVLGKSE